MPGGHQRQKRRLLQVKIVGGNGEASCLAWHNDGSVTELRVKEELPAFLERIKADAWTRESDDWNKDEWSETYVKWMDEPDPAEPPPLAYAGDTNSFRKGSRSWGYAFAVAIEGEWLATRDPLQRHWISVYRKSDDSGFPWKLHGSFSPDGVRPGGCLDLQLAMHGGCLVASSRQEGKLYAFRLHAGENQWVQDGQLPNPFDEGDSIGIGLSMQGDVVASNVWNRDARSVTVVIRRIEGSWKTEARIANPEVRVENAHALQGEWLFVGTGGSFRVTGSVLVFRYAAESGEWRSNGVLPRTHLPAELNFGAAVSAFADRVMVTGTHDSDRISFYRLVDGTWTLESTVKTDWRSDFQVCLLGDGVALVGDPRFASWRGSVVLLRETSRGNWVEVQELSPPDTRFDDRFGGTIARSNSWIAVGSAGAGHGGAAHLFRQRDL
jgi:hypothetical protein